MPPTPIMVSEIGVGGRERGGESRRGEEEGEKMHFQTINGLFFHHIHTHTLKHILSLSLLSHSLSLSLLQRQPLQALRPSFLASKESGQRQAREMVCLNFVSLSLLCMIPWNWYVLSFSTVFVCVWVVYVRFVFESILVVFSHTLSLWVEPFHYSFLLLFSFNVFSHTLTHTFTPFSLSGLKGYNWW